MLVKPVFTFDADSPIYKKGDPNQDGEAGKAVKVDKDVRYLLLILP